MSISQRGFTVVELVVTVVLLGILAVVVLPRLFNRAEYEARAFRDQVAATLRFAQKAAVAQRRPVCVQFATSPTPTLTLRVDADNNPTTGALGGCEADQIGPASSTLPYTLTAPTGVTMTLAPSTTYLTFAASGDVNLASNLTITIGPGALTLTVVEKTGYVY